MCLSRNKLCFYEFPHFKDDGISVVDLRRPQQMFGVIDVLPYINADADVGSGDEDMGDDDESEDDGQGEDESNGEEMLDNAISYDQTLVVSSGTLSYDRIMVWNLKTLQHITDLNIEDHEKLVRIDVQSDKDNVSVIAVAMDRGHLAVTIRLNQVDSASCIIFQTQLWKLNTEDPHTDNICYWKTIVHDYIYSKVNDNKYSLRMFVNAKYLCLALKSNECGAIKLQAFYLNDLSNAEEIAELFLEGGTDYDIRLETEMSNKIAVFDKGRIILKVYNLSPNKDNCCFEINLHQFLGKEPGNFVLANFLLGKLMLIRERARDNEIKFFIVTEDGAVIEGNKLELQQRDCRIQNIFFHADGIVVYTIKIREIWGEVLKKLFFYHPK